MRAYLPVSYFTLALILSIDLPVTVVEQGDARRIVARRIVIENGIVVEGHDAVAEKVAAYKRLMFSSAAYAVIFWVGAD